MSKKKQYKDVVGLIHPESIWHTYKYLTDGRAIVLNIRKSYIYPDWYVGEITHPNLSMHKIFISGFRPRRVLIK